MLQHTELFAQLSRPDDSHKGLFGSVAIVGGNIGMVGACLLAGRAAFAAGAGKVWLNVLDERLAVDVLAPELMVRGAMADLSGADALAVGMGLGQDAAAHHAFMHALSHSDQPLIIDADALNLLALEANDAAPLRHALHAHGRTTVLTPHPAEAARLLGCTVADVQADRLASAQKIAVRYSSVTVLKGSASIIAHPDGTHHINHTGNAALAVAGQGDVLSGVIVALLAQGLSAFAAASLAVYWHGLAGELYAFEAGGTVGLSASAMPSLLSRVINQWRAEQLTCPPNTPMQHH